MTQDQDTLKIAAQWGGDHCFFDLHNQNLRGELADYGPLDLRENTPHRFRSTAPLDSAGEFQWQVDWVVSDENWTWIFQSGLAGMKGKGGSFTWSLYRPAP